MEFLKHHYEKVCLGAVLLGLLAWCVFLGMSLLGVKEHIAALGGKGVSAGVKPIQSFSPEKEFATAQRAVADPRTQWALPAEGTLSPFVPRNYMWCMNSECSYILPEEYDKCPYCGSTQGLRRDGTSVTDGTSPISGGDGIPDMWKKKYPGVFEKVNTYAALLDPDDDGFNNYEEYKADTHPGNAAVHPPYAAKLFFMQTDQTPLPLRLDKISQEGKTKKEWIFQFSVVEGNRRVTRFARLGETLAGFLLADVVAKVTPVMDPSTKTVFDKDISELTIRRGEEAPMVLQPGIPAYERGIKVRLALVRNPLEPGKYQVVDGVLDGEVTVGVGAGAKETYKIVSASSNEAILQAGAKKFTIGRFRPPTDVPPPPRSAGFCRARLRLFPDAARGEKCF